MGVYEPDWAVNIIRSRKKPRMTWDGKREEPNFPTWEEAHCWLLDRRRQRLLRAENDFKAAKRSLAGAEKMRKPENVQDEQSKSGGL